jgi:hypothetical protein
MLVYNDVTSIETRMVPEGRGFMNTFDYLKPDKPKVGRFYLLPKIHKVNNPGRPIVSANGHPTEKNLRIRRFPPSTIVWLVFSSFPMKMLAYEGAILVPIAVPLICKKCSPLNVKLFHLRPHVEALPSYLKDTTDYLQKMESMNPLPSGTIVVSMDVTSLYTNIPHNDGIEAYRKCSCRYEYFLS